MQFGEPPLVAGAPGGHPIAQPILLHCDLAAELVLLIFLLLEYRIPPTLEGCETIFEHSGDAAVEPDGTLREPFEQASVMADQDDARAQFGQFAFQPLDAGQIQVIGRFVEQQKVGGRSQGARQCRATRFAAG